MHLLITRPEPDASAMRAMLEAEGLSADVAPLLEITVDAPDEELLVGASALVVTSRNGLRALETSPCLGELLARPLLVVGKGTGAAASALGFTDVTVGPATAKDLVPLIVRAWLEKIAPAAAKGSAAPGPIVHLSGDKISFDLEPPLAEAGLPFRRNTVYRSAPVRHLPQTVIDALAGRRYDGIVLMSPLTAQTFVDLAAAAGLAADASHATFLCLSQGIADIVAATGADRVKVAAKPNIEEMVALIRRLAAQSGPMSPAEK